MKALKNPIAEILDFGDVDMHDANNIRIESRS